MTDLKEKGGLGIRWCVRSLNLAFMAKLGWRFLTSREDLWARILQAKYVRGKVDDAG